MNCPYNVKVCTKCKRILIACEINFDKKKCGKYGLRADCKICKAKHNKQWREENKEKIKEKKKQYYKENKEHCNKKSRENYENNKEHYSELNKQWREENKEKIKEKKKQYYKENPHIKFNASNKRRNKLENQGNGITKEQWLEMMNYFNWCCAYSGEYIGGESEFRTIDHITPLSKGGEHEIWNCIPCYSNYNYQKHTKDMEQWYRQQLYFSEERLVKIYAWIEYAYNKWSKKRRKGNKK